jgi:hypothetical protein
VVEVLDPVCRLMEPMPENVPIDSFPETQEWSHDIQPQALICHVVTLVHTLICQSSMAFLVGFYRLDAPWTIRKSSISLLKSILKKPEQPVALAQILNKYCRKYCGCSSSSWNHNKIGFCLCPNSAQPLIFQCFQFSTSRLPTASMLR